MKNSPWIVLSVAVLCMGGMGPGCDTERSEAVADESGMALVQGTEPRKQIDRAANRPAKRRPGQPGFDAQQRSPRKPAAAQAPAGPQPRIVFDHKKYDFKTVIKGSKVTHSYPFTNTGKADLVIEKVQPSCGCVAIPLKKNRIAPGESSEIEVSFDSTQKSPGLQRFTIAVHTNDYLERDRGVKIAVLALQGDVIVFFKAVPPQFYLQGLTRGEATMRQVTVHSTGLEGEILEIDRIEVSNPAALSVEMIKPSRRAGTAKFGPDAVDLNLSYTPDRIGYVTETITIHTKSKEQPTILIPVRGRIQGSVKVTPPQIYVRKYQRGQKLVPNQITVSRTGKGPPLKVLELSSTEGLNVDLKEIVAGRHYAVQLNLDPSRTPGPFAGEVRILLNSEDQPIVRVPVTLYMDPAVQSTPEAVYFESEAGKPYVKQIMVRRLGSPDLQLELGEKTPAHFDVAILNPQRPNLPYRVTLTLKPNTQPGEIKDSLVLKTNVAGEEEIVIPINGVISQGG